jgi:hypothetical protein
MLNHFNICFIPWQRNADELFAARSPEAKVRRFPNVSLPTSKISYSVRRTGRIRAPSHQPCFSQNRTNHVACRHTGSLVQRQVKNILALRVSGSLCATPCPTKPHASSWFCRYIILLIIIHPDGPSPNGGHTEKLGGCAKIIRKQGQIFETSLGEKGA